MIRDLDETIRELLETQAVPGTELSGADITFDLPDSDWRGTVGTLTVNCYLYDIRQNTAMQTTEDLIQRSADGTRAIRRPAPIRMDCSYCITAWSPANNESVFDEHRLLSQVLMVLLRNPTIPTAVLQGGLVSQIPPYPSIVASPDGVKNQPEFWGALNQQLKPSLNYTVTLALMIDDLPAQMPLVVSEYEINADHKSVIDES